MSLTANMTKSIRRYLIAGVLVWLPIFITYFIVHFIVHLLDGTIMLLPAKYHPAQLIGYEIPGAGVVLTIIILVMTGLLVTNFIGHKLLSIWEKILSRIPLIRNIHSAAKQVVNAIIQPNGNAFRKVLLVQYPRVGLWSIAFQTSGVLYLTQHEKPVVSIFIPTTPNPTSGFLMFIPVDEIKELNITIEEALRMVISIGVIIPGQMTYPPAHSQDMQSVLSSTDRST
jgi:uncharacterized membrane protein